MTKVRLLENNSNMRLFTADGWEVGLLILMLIYPSFFYYL